MKSKIQMPWLCRIGLHSKFKSGCGCTHCARCGAVVKRGRSCVGNNP